MVSIGSKCMIQLMYTSTVEKMSKELLTHYKS